MAHLTKTILFGVCKRRRFKTHYTPKQSKFLAKQIPQYFKNRKLFDEITYSHDLFTYYYNISKQSK